MLATELRLPESFYTSDSDFNYPAISKDQTPIILRRLGERLKTTHNLFTTSSSTQQEVHIIPNIQFNFPIIIQTNDSYDSELIFDVSFHVKPIRSRVVQSIVTRTGKGKIKYYFDEEE